VEKLQTSFVLPTMLEQAVWMEEEKNTKQINSPTKYHKFVVLVRLENEVWLVKLTVRESEQKKRFYDHATVQKIKNSAWDDIGADFVSTPPASGILTAKIRELYEEYKQKLAPSNGLGRVEKQSTAIMQKQTMQSRLQRVLERDSSPEMQEKVRRAAVLLRLPVPQKPVAVQPSSDFSVLNIPFDEIFIDKARFQPRDDFSEEKVQEIVNNFNPALFKPLIVWRDPKDGKTYVLAGHHRYEALKRMGRKTVPVVYAQGGEQKAVELAWTENQSGRSQTSAENAKYLRKLAISGRTKAEIQAECQRLYNRSCQVALDLSFLNPRGKALVDFALMPRESEGFRDMETMCQWVGKLRGRFSELTNSHENEMYDFLKENYKIKGKKFRNGADFGAFIENIITKRTSFGVIDERLNINNFTPPNSVAAEYDAKIARAERELSTALDEITVKRTEAAKRLASGDITQSQVDVILKKYNDAAIWAEQEVLRLKEAKYSGVREAKASEMSLFGLSGIKSKNWNHHRFDVPEATYRLLGIPPQTIWADCEALFKKRFRKDDTHVFSSKEELCATIQFVLEAPDGAFTPTKAGAKGIFRLQNGVYLVVIEMEKKKDEARVVTAYFTEYEKFKQKIQKLNRAVANSPSSGDISTSTSESPSGRLGVPSDTHSIAVSTNKPTKNLGENQGVASVSEIKEKLLAKWNDFSLTAEEREKVRRAGVLLKIDFDKSTEQLLEAYANTPTVR
jgi:hypothetical protein